jgi:hypothetical protein
MSVSPAGIDVVAAGGSVAAGSTRSVGPVSGKTADEAAGATAELGDEVGEAGGGSVALPQAESSNIAAATVSIMRGLRLICPSCPLDPRELPFPGYRRT